MFTAPSRLLTRHRSICKMIQLLYSWLLQFMSRRRRWCKCWSSWRTFPSLNYWRGMPACLCAPPQPFTYFGCFGCTGSLWEPPAAWQLVRQQRQVTERWEREDMTLVYNAISVLFFPCKGPHKYLENKCISRVKYQSNSINADPSAGGRLAICPWYCWKFHEVLQIWLTHLSPDYSFLLHSELPSTTINFLAPPLISIISFTLSYKSWIRSCLCP